VRYTFKDFISFYAAVMILTLFTGVIFSQEGGYVIRPFDIMMAIAVLFLGGRLAKKGKLKKYGNIPIYLFITLYLYRGLSGALLGDQYEGLGEMIQGLEFLIFTYIIIIVFRERKNRLRFIKVLHIGFGIIAIVSSIMHVQSGQPDVYKSLPGGDQKYVFGLFGVTSFIYWMKKGGIFNLMIFTISVILVFLSGERKGMLALILTILTVLTKTSEKSVSIKMVKEVTMLIVVVIGAITFAWNYEGARGKIQDFRSNFEVGATSKKGYIYDKRYPDVGRYNGIIFTMNTLKERPIFGVGTGGGREYLRKKTASQKYIALGHGQYQAVSLENGLLGLALYLGIWIHVIVAIWKMYKSKGEKEEVDRLFVMCIVIYGVVINGLIAGGALNILFLSLVIAFYTALKK
jgi:O-antigen ligase